MLRSLILLFACDIGLAGRLDGLEITILRFPIEVDKFLNVLLNDFGFATEGPVARTV